MKEKKISILIAVIIVLLAITTVLSIIIGTRDIAFSDIFAILSKQKEDILISSILQKRLIRTVLGFIAGFALGISGCLMQSITRNPIADPSILGVNTGASLFVVTGIAFFNIHSTTSYIVFALAGAFIAALLVFGIASFSIHSYTNISPVRLALSGAAVSTACSSLISTVMLPRTNVMQVFRFWQTGSISGGSFESIISVMPLLILGVVISFLLIPSLNILALGDDTAVGLGVNVRRTRALAAFAGVLLCGGVTALCGPIGFVGLIIPHLIKGLVGNDLKVQVPFCAFGGSILLLIADVIGRIISRPSELEVGILTAFIGAPIFIMIVKNAKVTKS